MKNKRYNVVTSFLTNKIFFHTIKRTFYTVVRKDRERLNDHFALFLKLTSPNRFSDTSVADSIILF